MTSIKFRALTQIDHKLFFEALGEYGKDFQNIQQYMAQKAGGKGNKSSEQSKSLDHQERRDQDKKEDDKKREQIRNFYNKLYTKLSQLIGRLDDRIEKVNQELYLLINYGEIWKKHGFKFNNKTKKLLEELVYQGYTTLRFKNKNVRLRTPSCKALKKLNEIGIDEKVKVVTTRELPKDVVVEFLPATNRDWLKVQSMSQNPRVRAKLSIQKRIPNILKFLETKWNISPEKLNRTIDGWLKVRANQVSEDVQQQSFTTSVNNHQPNNVSPINVQHSSSDVQANMNGLSTVEPNHATNTSDMYSRLRLKPSARHELKEVNITRVVPDSHLDVSLNAYLKRLGDAPVKEVEICSKNNNQKDASSGSIYNTPYDINGHQESFEHSLSTNSTVSRLPVSLTTPDCSILLERSMTSDQPSIAQARKHLNILQSLAVSFEGCENSRTACEDTQDRSLLTSTHIESCRPRPIPVQTHSTLMMNNIPALFDDDAAICNTFPPAINSQEKTPSELVGCRNLLDQSCNDSQNSKCVDFHIPKNVTLGDYFKMTGPSGGDEANDAFPSQPSPVLQPQEDCVVDEICKQLEPPISFKMKTETLQNSPNSQKFQNHMIEIKRLAEGWTRHDQFSLTIGELYLALKCPDKIVLEYEFENFKPNTDSRDLSVGNHMGIADASPSVDKINESTDNGTLVVGAGSSNKNSLIFKLLTAASLSLAQIERQKQEQQHKLHEQSSVKLKRRKGPSNPNTIKFLKRDEALPTNNFLRHMPVGQHGDTTVTNVNQSTDDNNYLVTGNDKAQQAQHQVQDMTSREIEVTNQRVEEVLKQLQPTRLTVFRRAR